MKNLKERHIQRLRRPLLRTVKATVVQHRLLSEESRVLVACSGGVDSLVLLHALLDLRNHMHQSWTLGVITVDHGIRLEGADELTYVETMVRDLGLFFYGYHIDVPALASLRKASIETVGRQERYRLFREVAESEGYTCVALAHHRDDQSETILSHLVRGSGLVGLQGMAYKRSLTPSIDIIRPLLDLPKTDLRAYAETIPYQVQEDPSNQDRTYERNFLRHEILPRLRTINPQVDQALNKLGQHARQDQAFLLECARRHLSILLGLDGRDLPSYFTSLREKKDLAVVQFSRRAFRACPKALQGRMWGLLFGAFTQDSLTHAHL